jgi:hypothetical protein
MTTEEKIFIAAGFDSEKIKMIRELMEEEAERFANFISDHPLDFELTNKQLFLGLDLVYYTSKQLYQQFKQTK